MSIATTFTITDGAHEVTYVDAGGASVTADRSITARVFAPDTPGTYPVIFYSHGYSGSPFLGAGINAAALADQGYIVIAPAHLDSASLPVEVRDDFSPFDPVTVLHRVADLQFLLTEAVDVIDALPAGYAGDLSYPVAAGHSLGAFTTALLVGATSARPGYAATPGNPFGLTSVADPRFEAAVLLSPQGVDEDASFTGFTEMSWDGITVPALTIAGTADTSPEVADYRDRLQGFDLSPAGNKHAVVIAGATHNEIGGLADDAAITSEITRAADTFLDAYVAGDPAQLARLEDTAAYEASSDLVAEVYARTFDLFVNIDGVDSGTVAGTAGDDTLAGLTTVDRISGGDGADTVLGSEEADLIFGGAGSDTVSYQSVNGFLYADLAAGLSQIAFGDETGRAFTSYGQRLESIENVIGTDVTSAGAVLGQGDVVFGDAGANTVLALAEADYIDGRGGDDLLYGGTGTDAIIGGLGDDYAEGGDGADTLLLDDFSNPGGPGGADVALGGAGNDLLWGYAGNDALYGEAGNDALVGNDFASVAAGFDILYGGDGDDTLFVGLGGSAVLDGGAGADALYGGGGAESLIGGSGSDFLFGDAGGDLFVLTAADLQAGDIDILYFFDATADLLQFDAALRGQISFANVALEVAGVGFVDSVYMTHVSQWSAAAYGVTVDDLAARIVYA